MDLTTSRQTEFFQYSFEGPTVIEPGLNLTINLTISALKPFHFQAIQWQIPDVLSSEIEFLAIDLDMQESSAFSKELIFFSQADKEGFGEMKFKIIYSVGVNLIAEQEEIIWISVFKRGVAPMEALDDKSRERLVSVVNFRPRNGHIFLADFVSFFDDFLNIEVPTSIAEILARDFNFSDEGLPQDHMTYTKFIIEEERYYAIEKVELIYEEDCNESDDRFDIQEAREVEFPSMD